jgi:hypothetical protein
VVRKVQIERFDHIPSMIELVGKTLKMDDRREARKQRSMESLACPCEHPSVIKFLPSTQRPYGGIHVVVEWGNSSRNVGLQHEIFPHCSKGNQIWKCEHDLSPLGEIM